MCINGMNNTPSSRSLPSCGESVKAAAGKTNGVFSKGKMTKVEFGGFRRNKRKKITDEVEKYLLEMIRPFKLILERENNMSYYDNSEKLADYILHFIAIP